jgi:hypothetical protein
MNVSSKRIILGVLAFPIVILLAIVCYLQYQRQHLPTYVVPVAAYDPRSFLSGHFLTVTLADEGYHTQFKCQGVTGEAYSCWQQQADRWQVKIFKDKPAPTCQIIDSGYCYRGNFTSSTTLRFFIPEDKAKSLEEAILQNRGSMKIMALPTGELRPLELYIDGKDWKQSIK